MPLIIASAPLIILPGTLFFYDVTPKVAVILLGTAIALLFFRQNTQAVSNLLQARSGRWLAGLLLAQICSLVLSTILSAHPTLSIGGTNWRRWGLITQIAVVVLTLLLAAHSTASKVLTRRVLAAASVAGCIAAAYAILQYFGWDPLLDRATYEAGEGALQIVRPPGTMGHAAYLGTFLPFAFFAAAASSSWRRSLRWIACGLIAAGIVVSGTRAALLGLGVGLLMLMLMNRQHWRFALATSVCAALALAVFLVSPGGERLRARVQWAAEDLRGGARLWLWRDSLRFASAHPLLGNGPETFSADFGAYQSVELSMAYPDFYHESPHNILLDVYASQGLPGLAVLIAITALGFLAAKSSPVLAAGLLAVVVSLQFTAFTAVTALAFYTLVALIAATAVRNDETSVKRPWISAPVLAATVLTIAAVRLIVADRHLESVKVAFDQGRPAQGREAYEQCLRWALPGGSPDLYYSRRAAAAGHYQEAARAAIRATETAEDPQNAFYSLASIYAALNDTGGVERSLVSAIRLSPNWYKPHWTLAQVYEKLGRVADASREAAIAADLAGGKHPEVVETLTRINSLDK